MAGTSGQGLLFTGVYEFEDPSGHLLAAKIPADGSLDLYNGTKVTVRPNQCACFMYKGKFADIYMPGLHTISTENTPLLTRLANVRLGFQSPLRCELWFFSLATFPSLKWGTPQPVIYPIDGMPNLALRANGQYSLHIRHPLKLYNWLVKGTQLDILDVEEAIQGQIAELLPNALKGIKTLVQISSSQEKVSQELERLVNEKLIDKGIELKDLQVMSLLPPPEVMRALNAQTAMQVVGNKQDYLIYQAANSLDQMRAVGGGGASGDPMQLMMGLMLGKGLSNQVAAPANQPIPVSSPVREIGQGEPNRQIASGGVTQASAQFCSQCGARLAPGARFCSQCGKGVGA